ncbi:apolipoprotein N-acyltransferase [Spirulina major CS-329]|uniref:apolipoprotein N-acyltransferase n=1 Tax=Spirulina TaxID=1154 RepID=UPI00232F6B27|nr:MULTISPECIES: apolipoprotein N-acyltransferase [Spirulina]MDB9495780.1 apolipoprotein N-acyltransferase [Spirulina subsalsa CS-330]MDB9503228.1 apolipoprotein N-acyltransferase [Spirulina major CS-329]
MSVSVPVWFQSLTIPALALGGGLLMGCTPAPVSAPPLAWVAIAVLWVTVVQAPSRGQRLLRAIAWGIGFHGVALFWITGVHPMTWMGVPWLASLVIALLCWVLITAWGVALVVVWALLLGCVSPVHPLRHLLFGVALWCGLEGLWQLGPLWWSSIAYSQSPGNLWLLHWGQISGPTTITALLMAVNGGWALAYLKRRQWRRYASGAIALLLLAHLGGFYLATRPLQDQPAQGFEVGIIQGNVPNEIKLYPEGWAKAIAGYTQGYTTLARQGVDVILTPETALPFAWEDLVQNHHPFYQAVRREGTPVWLGAFGSQGRSDTNSLFTLTGTGQLYSRYDKVKLVPLGEYIPAQALLGRVLQRLSPLDAHLAAGSPRQVFKTPWGRAIVGICYESAFARHFQRQAAAGGEFILTASNNAHYSEVMPAQHHALDVMRAVELSRWAVRATNTGYSAIVTPHGQTEWISEINTYALHRAMVYRRSGQTLYGRWGDWLGLGLGAIALLFLILRLNPSLRHHAR